MKRELIIILLLLFISFPAFQALLQPGGFTSHDLTHHIIRQISMDKLLGEGQFPPRWSGELNNGYGYPVFLFNYPLPALVSEIFHKLGLGLVDSVKAVLLTSMIVSVLGMYLFLRSLLNNRMAAFLGSIFYLYAPIRFLNVYVSASVGSALALAIIPFVFWSLVEIKNGKKWASMAGALSLAALILAHNVTALIFMPMILAFAWIIMRDVRGVREVGVMFLLGLGLSAWFWLPAIVEKQYILFDQIFQGFYKDQFINFWQLLRSPWGYGLSHPMRPEPGDMSYQLGLVHIGVMLIFGLWFMVYGRKIGEVKKIGTFVLTFFLLSIFLMLKISQPLWDHLSFLSLVQFPLRFLSIAIFCASIATGLLIKWIRLGRMTRGLLFITLLLLVIYANRNHWKINEKFDPGDNYYLDLKTTSTTYGEHLPKWGKVAQKPSPGKLEFINRAGKINILKNQSANVLAEVEATQPGKLRFNQFYFPGWDIKVDGKSINFNYQTDGESYGMPVFDIDSGKHLVVAKFKNTADRNLADGISVIIFIVFIIYICRLLIKI